MFVNLKLPTTNEKWAVSTHINEFIYISILSCRFLASVLKQSDLHNSLCHRVDQVFLPPAGDLLMGGSSSKTSFFGKKKKKKSPLNKAWSELKGALPNKKSKKKKKNILDKLNLDNLKREKHSQKRFSLPTDKKEPISLKRLSLGNLRKGSTPTASPGRKEKDGGGLEKAGEQMKRKLSSSALKKRLSLPV